jgi:tetratricopeptide (TPR) repeat protein
MIGLGSALWGQGEYNKAIELFESALKLNPSKTDLLLRVAKIHENHLNAPDDAIAILRRYMALVQAGPESNVAKRIQMLIDVKKMNEEGSMDDADPFGDEDADSDPFDEDSPAEEAPAEEAPAEEAPAEEAPAEEAPAEEAPSEEAPVEETSTDEEQKEK